MGTDIKEGPRMGPLLGYHVTARRRLASIRQSGLVPEWGGGQPRLFFYARRQDAERFAYRGHVAGDSPVVLTVNLDGLEVTRDTEWRWDGRQETLTIDKPVEAYRILP